MTASERVSYLKGLADGLGLDPQNKHDKLISAIIDALEDFAVSISDLEESYDDLCDQVDAIDEDLASVEEDLYEEDDDDDYDDGIYYEVTCPSCGEEICLDEDMVAEGSMECPNCGTDLEFDDCSCEECEAGGSEEDGDSGRRE